ncbi:unnamed protein product [Rhizoctonia solani]|uniref:Uncharacterized protein n=1 Tax=Rhizoctonia solani TaxID=456999 RepID=A0A8H3C3I8_9AGAM|nr:unnamed protein product [Rhizoctonia solani]
MSASRMHTRSSQSNRSNVYEDDSASILASESEFARWATLVGLDPTIRSEIPQTHAFKIILDMQNLSNRFPTWLTSRDSLQFKFLPEGYQPFKDTLCSELKELKDQDPGMFHEEEDLPLCGAIGSILQTCRHNSILRDYRNNPTEMDRRNTVDALLGHVCESDKNLVVQYSNEQELKLPRAKVGCYNVTNTIVDGVMFVEVTAFKPYLANYEMQVAATALGPKTPKHLRVVHCVTGFKRSNGANQAIMGVVSGIYQKRILGVPGQFTFGVFQYQKSFLEIFAGIWRSDEVK